MYIDIDVKNKHEVSVNEFRGYDKYFGLNVDDYEFRAFVGRFNIFLQTDDLNHGYKLFFLNEEDFVEVFEGNINIHVPKLWNILSIFLIHKKLCEDNYSPEVYHIFKVNIGKRAIFGITMDDMDKPMLGHTWGYYDGKLTQDDLENKIKERMTAPLNNYLHDHKLLEDDKDFDDKNGSNFRLLEDGSFRLIDIDMGWIQKLNQLKIELMKLEHKQLIKNLLNHV